MKRDGYKNKYTNPRRAEVTTDKYQVEIQTIKLTRNKHPKRLQVSKTQQETSENSDIVTCDKCGKTFKKRPQITHSSKTCNGIKKNIITQYPHFSVILRTHI